jgi:membrane-bound serine protease (ClpP class)
MFPDTPGQGRDLLYGVITLILAVFTSGVAMYFISRHFTSLPIFSRLVLKDPETDPSDELLPAMDDPSRAPLRPGITGTAVTPLRPAGRVDVDGRIIDVVAEMGFIRSGAPVRIVTVSPFRITVEAIQASDAV